LIVGGVQGKHAGPLVEAGTGVRAAGVGIQQAAVGNPLGRANQELDGDVAQGVQGCHAANSSGAVFRKRNAIGNITISHRNPGKPCYPVVH
jgi:hypothetical protein